jgi:hypothetical protein
MIDVYVGFLVPLIGLYLFGVGVLDFKKKKYQKKTRLILVILGVLLIAIWAIPASYEANTYQRKKSFQEKGNE